METRRLGWLWLRQALWYNMEAMSWPMAMGTIVYSSDLPEGLSFENDMVACHSGWIYVRSGEMKSTKSTQDQARWWSIRFTLI